MRLLLATFAAVGGVEAQALRLALQQLNCRRPCILLLAY